MSGSRTVSRQERAGWHATLACTAGTITRVEDAAAIPGTSIEVSELFYNTPARRKFLKSTTTEFSHISHVVQQAALASPQVHVRLIHNGYEVFACPPCPRLAIVCCRCIAPHSVTGRWPSMFSRTALSLRGFIIDPVRARAGRTPQELFVNRRPIKNSTVQHAVVDGYSSFLAKGHAPLVCALS
jgi:DNA mismatch repair protein MutL